MKNYNMHLLLFVFLLGSGTLLAQRIPVPKPRPKPTPEPSVSLKRQYDNALKKGSDVSYKHSMKTTVVQQTSRNVEIAKNLKPMPSPSSRPVNRVSMPVRNQININQANNRAKQSAQKTVDRWNYNRAKQELKAKPTQPARKIAGQGTNKEFRKAESVANNTGSKPQNLTKVSSSKQGGMEAHGVVDIKSKKLVEVKPKKVYPPEPKATQKRVQKKENKFKENASSVTKPQPKPKAPAPTIKTYPPKPQQKTKASVPAKRTNLPKPQPKLSAPKPQGKTPKKK